MIDNFNKLMKLDVPLNEFGKMIKTQFINYLKNKE